jgi:hydroxymethylpyrimidine pyrophosphatase-like HAD family hydrolase
VSPPRLVATDLDGTLVRSDGTVSPRSARVLADLDARGVPVVFVTRRSPSTCVTVAPMVLSVASSAPSAAS